MNLIINYFFSSRRNVHELTVVLSSRAHRVRSSFGRFAGRDLRLKTSRLHLRRLHRRQVLCHDLQRILQVVILLQILFKIMVFLVTQYF
jgi:allophanate hydrolase subunit 2